MNIENNLLNKLSFPDFMIKKMVFSDKLKVIEIYIEGDYLDIKGGMFLKNGKIILKNYKRIIAKLFDNESWKMLTSCNYDELKSLEEFIYLDSNIILKGFGKNTGKWIEYIIFKPLIDVEFVNDY